MIRSLIAILEQLLTWIERGHVARVSKKQQAQDDETFRDSGSAFDEHFGMRDPGTDETPDEARDRVNRASHRRAR